MNRPIYDPANPPAEESKEYPMLQPGNYQAHIKKVELTTSKKGKEYFKVQLTIQHEEQVYTVFDNPSWHWMPFKLHHMSEACGVLPQYNDDSLTCEHLQGATVRVTVGVQEATDQYKAKNSVEDYLVGDAGGKAPTGDDDLPF